MLYSNFSWISIGTGIISALLLLPCLFTEFDVSKKEHNFSLGKNSSKYIFGMSKFIGLNIYITIIQTRNKVIKTFFHSRKCIGWGIKPNQEISQKARLLCSISLRCYVFLLLGKLHCCRNVIWVWLLTINHLLDR